MSDRLYKRVIGVASLFALVALMLTACVAPAPGAQPAADSAEAVEAPAETAAVDDSVSIGMNELVTSLDPPADWAIAATWIHMNLFDCLVWRNRDTAVFEPWLAESYEQVSDKVWKLKLREQFVR